MKLQQSWAQTSDGINKWSISVGLKCVKSGFLHSAEVWMEMLDFDLKVPLQACRSWKRQETRVNLNAPFRSEAPLLLLEQVSLDCGSWRSAGNRLRLHVYGGSSACFGQTSCSLTFEIDFLFSFKVCFFSIQKTTFSNVVKVKVNFWIIDLNRPNASHDNK